MMIKIPKNKEEEKKFPSKKSLVKEVKNAIKKFKADRKDGKTVPLTDEDRY